MTVDAYGAGNEIVMIVGYGSAYAGIDGRRRVRYMRSEEKIW